MAEDKELQRIFDYIKIECDNYRMFPQSGWWQIENKLNQKYDIIIKDYYLEASQKYYIRLILDKNSQVKKFSYFEKKNIFPRNLMSYAKSYFSVKKKELPKVKQANNQNTNDSKKEKNQPQSIFKTPEPEYRYLPPQISGVDNYQMKKNGQEKQREAVDKLPDSKENLPAHKILSSEQLDKRIKMFDTDIQNDIIELKDKDNLEGKILRFKSSLKKIEDESIESEKIELKKNNENQNSQDYIRAEKIESENNKKLVENNIENLNGKAAAAIDKTVNEMNQETEYQRQAGGELNVLKNDLESALSQINILNESIKGFLKNVDMRTDAKFQALLQENKNLGQQLENANRLVGILKNNFASKLDDSFKKNEALVKKNQSLSESLAEFTDILNEYQKQNLELTDFLRVSTVEIERLKKTNKMLLFKMNVELEDIRRENKVLKERLEIQTKSLAAPSTDFNLDFNNQGAPK